MSAEQPAYEAPAVTPLGSLHDLTQFTIHGEEKKFAKDVDWVGWFPVLFAQSK